MIFTKAKISPVGTVNKKDLKKIALDTARFFVAPVLMYLAQLTGTLSINKVLLGVDFVPSLMTIGAIQGWGIGVGINFFLRLRDGGK